jgi:hypothetical protein
MLAFKNLSDFLKRQFPGLEDVESGYPLMMMTFMPTGLLGLMVTGFLAAL